MSAAPPASLGEVVVPTISSTMGKAGGGRRGEEREGGKSAKGVKGGAQCGRLRELREEGEWDEECGMKRAGLRGQTEHVFRRGSAIKAARLK